MVKDDVDPNTARPNCYTNAGSSSSSYNTPAHKPGTPATARASPRGRAVVARTHRTRHAHATHAGARTGAPLRRAWPTPGCPSSHLALAPDLPAPLPSVAPRTLATPTRPPTRCIAPAPRRAAARSLRRPVVLALVGLVLAAAGKLALSAASRARAAVTRRDGRSGYRATQRHATDGTPAIGPRLSRRQRPRLPPLSTAEPDARWPSVPLLYRRDLRRGSVGAAPAPPGVTKAGGRNKRDPKRAALSRGDASRRDAEHTQPLSSSSRVLRLTPVLSRAARGRLRTLRASKRRTCCTRVRVTLGRMGRGLSHLSGRETPRPGLAGTLDITRKGLCVSHTRSRASNRIFDVRHHSVSSCSSTRETLRSKVCARTMPAMIGTTSRRAVPMPP